jgi:hypothetical protein
VLRILEQEKMMSRRIDKEKTKKNIAFILDKMKNEADPRLLNEYRSIFRREVSLFNRSYTAAYLLMLYEQGRLGRNQTRNFEKRSGYDGNAGEGAPFGEQGGKDPGRSRQNGENQYPLAEEDSKYLFISIGRNRRVFPREILGLIYAKTGVLREDIGVIRILDKYSFVQVRDSAAGTIIEALNGKSFRGRLLSVNYAHTRRDDEDSARTGDPASGYGEPAGGTDGEARVLEYGLKENDDHPDEEDI